MTVKSIGVIGFNYEPNKSDYIHNKQ